MAIVLAGRQKEAGSTLQAACSILVWSLRAIAFNPAASNRAGKPTGPSSSRYLLTTVFQPSCNRRRTVDKAFKEGVSIADNLAQDQEGKTGASLFAPLAAIHAAILSNT